jgi:uncharacterized protein YcnI
MTRSSRPRRTAAAALSAAMLGLLAAPAQGVNIPEGGAVSADSVQIIHFQVREGCDGLPTDSLEVVIPEAVVNPSPEAMPGWSVETETVVIAGADEEAEPQVSRVRWTGGPLEDGQFLEFGLWARFPDDPDAVLEFPVIQRCGEVERAWTGEDEAMPAPTVTLQPRLGPRGMLGLVDAVAALESRVLELEDRLGDVNPQNLRTRVSDNESAVSELQGGLAELEQRVSDLEEGS